MPDTFARTSNFDFRWILFYCALCPLNLIVVPFSLENIVLFPLLLQPFISGKLKISYLSICLFFFLTIVSCTFALMKGTIQIELKMWTNMLSGLIIYNYYLSIKNIKQNHEYIICFFIFLVIFFANYLMLPEFSWNKNYLTYHGFNPNAKINSLVLFIICVQIFNEKNNRYSAFMSSMILIISAVFSTRQNIVASILLLLKSVKTNPMFIFLLFICSLIYVPQIDGLISYIVKGLNQIFNLTEITRIEYLLSSIEKVDINPLNPQFNHLIDNTIMSYYLQTNIFFGSVFFLLIVISLIIVSKISYLVSLSLCSLLILQDLHVEATFWLIIFFSINLNFKLGKRWIC